MFFEVLSILTLKLEGKGPSNKGSVLEEMIRLSPTVYPIVFSSIATRFYKNLARWSLEQPNGVKLATIEQLFGSQSFAGAFERLFTVRTHIMIGAMILLTWSLSPLGGQSASRILTIGQSRDAMDGTIYYAHPAYQSSYMYNWNFFGTVTSSVVALYTSCLMSPFAQRQSTRDPWGLPKIPQWPKNRTDIATYLIDYEALERGEQDYVSLLGLRIQGLSFQNGSARYDFSLETSYIDLHCYQETVIPKPPGGPGDPIDPSRKEMEERYSINLNPILNYTDNHYKSFTPSLHSTVPWQQWQQTYDPGNLYLLFASVGSNATKGDTENKISHSHHSNSYIFLFNCSMKTISIETDFECPSVSNCSAVRQRRKVPPKYALPYPESMLRHPTGLRRGLLRWPLAAGDDNIDRASPIESFISGEVHPYSGQTRCDWTNADMSSFSRRITTAFNTYWDVTIDPVRHTSTEMTAVPVLTDYKFADDLRSMDDGVFYNSTTGQSRLNNVYLADGFWIGFLLMTTMVLQVLAILGLVLGFFIRGPDVLGFVSSFTRDNPHTPLPSGGSALSGAERSRLLRGLRVQLGDVRATEDDGYIAFRALSSNTKPSGDSDVDGSAGERGGEGEMLWRPLVNERQYS